MYKYKIYHIYIYIYIWFSTYCHTSGIEILGSCDPSPTFLGIPCYQPLWDLPPSFLLQQGALLRYPLLPRQPPPPIYPHTSPAASFPYVIQLLQQLLKDTLPFFSGSKSNGIPSIPEPGLLKCEGTEK